MGRAEATQIAVPERRYPPQEPAPDERVVEPPHENPYRLPTNLRGIREEKICALPRNLASQELLKNSENLGEVPTKDNLPLTRTVNEGCCGGPGGAEQIRVIALK